MPFPIEPPISLFNTKALFNPYQYKPFNKIMYFNNQKNIWEHNGKDIFITDEVGVGKTFEAGYIIQELLKNDPNISVLILSPVKLCQNWEKEMRENFYLSFNNFHQRKTLGQLNIVPISYFRLYKKNNFNEEKTDNEFEEELYSDVDPYLEQELKNKIAKLKYDILIIDEVHYTRNKGKLWYGINELINNNGKAKLKIFMTATPVFNDNSDYENITDLLKPDYANTTTLQGESNCYDFLLDIKRVPVILSNSEKTIMEEIFSYIEFETSWSSYLKSKYGSLTGFLKRIATSSMYSLKQFVNQNSHFEDSELELYNNFSDSDLKFSCLNWEEKDDSKFMALENLLIDIKEENEKLTEQKEPIKIIIFTCFIDTCTYLSKRLKEYEIFMITGKVNAKKVERAKQRFKESEHDAILICSDAAKEGHNLQECHYMIHYDFPFTPAALSQRNGRIYRIGQKYNPKIYYLTVENSYDERLFGEIIVNKTEKVKDVSNLGLISPINVLPQDSEDYIKICLTKYFEDEVEKRENRWNRENSEKTSKEYEYFEREQLKYFLKKKDLNDKIAEYNDNFNYVYTEEFINYFFVNTNKDISALVDYYKQQYKKEMISFIEKLHLKISENLTFKEIQNEFRKHCDNYLNSQLMSKNNLFCHDMIDNDKLSIGQYKKQFQPLILCKKNKE